VCVGGLNAREGGWVVALFGVKCEYVAGQGTYTGIMAEPGSQAWALRGSLSGVHVPSLTERMSSLKETTAGRASSSVVKEKPPVLPAVSETPRPAEAAAPDPAAVAAPSPPAAVPEPAPPPAAVPEAAPAVGPEARCVVLEKENAELRAKNEALLAQVGKQVGRTPLPVRPHAAAQLTPRARVRPCCPGASTGGAADGERGAAWCSDQHARR